MPSRINLPTYDVELHRIEVTRGERGEDIAWSVNVSPVSPSMLIAVGVLRRSHDNLKSQALCLARVKDLDIDTWSSEVLKRWLSSGPVELMYDICRRSLMSQASYMDGDLALPLKAPVARFEIPSLADVFPDQDESRS